MLTVLRIPLFSGCSHWLQIWVLGLFLHHLMVHLYLRLSLANLLTACYISGTELDGVSCSSLAVSIVILLRSSCIGHRCHSCTWGNLLLHRNASILSFGTQWTQILFSVLDISLSTSATAWMVLAYIAIRSDAQSFSFPSSLLTVILLSLIKVHLLLDKLVSVRLSLETAILRCMTVVIASGHVSVLLAILIITHVH